MAIIDDYAAIAKLMKGELKPQPKLIPMPRERKPTLGELMQLGPTCGICLDNGWIEDPFGPVLECHACGNPKGLKPPGLRVRIACIDCLGAGNFINGHTCNKCQGQGWSYTP